MTKLARVRLKNLYDQLFKAQTTAERIADKDRGTSAGLVGTDANEKLEDLMQDISSLLADDEDGSDLPATEVRSES